MPPFLPRRRWAGPLAATFLVGALGGAALGLPGVPAGWLSGAMLAVSAWALAGRPVAFPATLGKIVLVVVGISLGAAVTPASVARMAAWPLSLAILALAMATVTFLVALYLRLVHGWDALSALFAAAPGAVSQALALAAQSTADLRAVAVVQSVRLFVLIVALPIALAGFSVVGAPLEAVSQPLADSPRELLLLVGVSSLCGVLALHLRVPGGLLVGAMVASGALHGTGYVEVALPRAVVIAGFVMMGTLIGTRFAGTDLRLLGRMLVAGLGALAVGTLVACAFALAAAGLLSLPVGDAIVAYAPGGLEAMAILALALHLDPAYVGVHHLGRFIFVSIALPIAVRLVSRATPHTGTGEGPPDNG